MWADGSASRTQAIRGEADTRFMANHGKPWWEQPAKAPHEAEFESEREHLRAELARAWGVIRDGQRTAARGGDALRTRAPR